jgi:hypothetical protein
VLIWPILLLMLFHLFVAPVLLALRVIQPGFRRVY